jgi:VWFA-related protein
MSYPPQCLLTRRGFTIVLLCLFAVILASVPFQAQPHGTEDPPPASSTPSQAQAQPAKPQEPASNDSAEMSSHDTAPTFKVRVNLVLVRVVVRDPKGNIVSDLKRDDFQLFDNRKPQAITSFSVETPESHMVPVTTADSSAPPDPDAVKAAASLPQRFVSVVFDDQHLEMQDVMFVRQATTKFLDSLAASDRVGIYSTSGQTTQEFTDDRDALRKTLLGILPRSPTRGFQQCPDMSYYEADLIENKHDPQAVQIATQDAIACAFGGDQTQAQSAQAMAISTAAMVTSTEDSSTEYALRHMEQIMRRLGTMPGQRVMLFVSPGFLTSTLFSEFTNVVDSATKANIVINTIDARGLYTPDMGDIANPSSGGNFATSGIRGTYALAAQTAQDDVLAQFADGTGGTFFHNRNDLDRGMKEAAAAPSITYLLGFSPQNLKLDGALHTIKVSLTKKNNYQIQARHGYYAPRHVVDPVESAKQEIQEAIFSQDEIRDLPVDLHTQFFKTTPTDARLAVLTHLEIKGMHFRKADGRNRDNITVATAIFDENGNFITGGEKIVEMKLLDTTYDRLSHSGLNLKSSFDVKPGSYLVRQVVRDSEGAQLAARNGAVVIPF